jgi:hypothetical protein
LLGQASFQLEGEKGRPNGVTDFWETSPPSPGWHQRRLGWQRWLQCFIGGAHCCANSWQSLTNVLRVGFVKMHLCRSLSCLRSVMRAELENSFLPCRSKKLPYQSYHIHNNHHMNIW